MRKHWKLLGLIFSAILSISALICMFLGYPPAVIAWILIPILPLMLLLIKYPIKKVTEKVKITEVN